MKICQCSMKFGMHTSISLKKLILEKLATLRENEQEDEINNVICCIVMLYVFSIIYSNILNINEKSNEENCRF